MKSSRLTSLFFLLIGSKLTAAVLSGTVTTTGLGTGVDLTAISDINWAIWDDNSGTSTSTRSATNTMSGAPGMGSAGYISSIAHAGPTGTTVRGGADGTYEFSYSDGASPASFTAQNVGLIFDASLNEIGSGVSFSITGDISQAYRVDIWATGFRAIGEMTASLNGASDEVLTSQDYGETKSPTRFSFIFQPDNATDTLNLTYLATSQGGSSHVGIQAVTITAIPEPSALLSSLLGLAVLLKRRR